LAANPRQDLAQILTFVPIPDHHRNAGHGYSIA